MNVSLRTHQLEAHFHALNEGLRLALVDSRKYTQVEVIHMSVEECFMQNKALLWLIHEFFSLSIQTCHKR